MDAAYALLIEEYTRVGISLLEAVEQTAGMRAGGPSLPADPAQQSEEELARQNQAAMRELQKQMGGLGT